MRPAFSLVAFTTLSGAGFGLMFWLGLGVGPDAAWFAWLAAIVCGGLAAAGIGASSLHLGSPGRAWRSFSQWRSSWLSREAVLAAATAALFGLYAGLWTFAGQRLPALGLVVAALSAVTVFATAMIYAQLRTVPRWATALTPASFLAFAATGGVLLAMSLAPGSALVPLAAAALVAAWGVKLAWWRRAARTTRASAGGSVEAATGLGGIGTVRQFEPPHTGQNYLLREMVFVVARRRARALRRLALLVGGVVPLAALAASALSGEALVLPALATLCFFAGLMCERWLFFAEAEHVVGAYYGAR